MLTLLRPRLRTKEEGRWGGDSNIGAGRDIVSKLAMIRVLRGRWNECAVLAGEMPGKYPVAGSDRAEVLTGEPLQGPGHW